MSRQPPLLFAWSFVVSAFFAPSEAKFRILGAGPGRTGTSSLQEALATLGYKPVHFKELFFETALAEAWGRLVAAPPGSRERNAQLKQVYELAEARGYDASVDMPWSDFVLEAADLYPKAKIVLTTRNHQRWAESFEYLLKVAVMPWHRFPLNQVPLFQKLKPIHKFFIRTWCEVDADECGEGEARRTALVAKLAHWEELVKNRIPEQRLLVFRPSDGWTPLCRFLNVTECPLTPYPKVNDRRTLDLFRYVYIAVNGFWPVLLLLLVLLLTGCGRACRRCCCPCKVALGKPKQG